MKSCHKQVFETKDQADITAKIRTRQYRKKHNSYKCSYCEKWHLTHQSKKIRRSAMKRNSKARSALQSAKSSES